jgi:hypothetical protein
VHNILIDLLIAILIAVIALLTSFTNLKIS